MAVQTWHGPADAVSVKEQEGTANAGRRSAVQRTDHGTVVDQAVAVVETIARWLVDLPQSLRQGGSSLRLTVFMKRDAATGSYVAGVEELPGCLAQGETEAEALEELEAALEAVLTLNLREQVKEAEEKVAGAGARPARQVLLSLNGGTTRVIS